VLTLSAAGAKIFRKVRSLCYRRRIRPYAGSSKRKQESLLFGRTAQMRWLHSFAVALFFMVFLPAVTGSMAQAQSAPIRADTQVWSDLQIAVPLSQQVDFVMTGTLRVGRQVHRPVDERLGAGFSLKAGKYLTLAPSY